jgi:hypothetical protein
MRSVSSKSYFQTTQKKHHSLHTGFELLLEVSQIWPDSAAFSPAMSRQVPNHIEDKTYSQQFDMSQVIRHSMNDKDWIDRSAASDRIKIQAAGKFAISHLPFVFKRDVSELHRDWTNFPASNLTDYAEPKARKGKIRHRPKLNRLSRLVCRGREDLGSDGQKLSICRGKFHLNIPSLLEAYFIWDMTTAMTIHWCAPVTFLIPDFLATKLNGLPYSKVSMSSRSY